MEKGEKQGRRTYTKEFKLEAVRLVRTGIPKARVSRDLGIHLNVLKAWLGQFDQDPDNPFPGKGKMKPEEAESPACSISPGAPALGSLQEPLGSAK